MRYRNILSRGHKTKILHRTALRGVVNFFLTKFIMIYNSNTSVKYYKHPR